MTYLPIELLRLGLPDAGEVLTLRRAAYVTEAQAHDDLTLPPLTETLGDVRAQLADPGCVTWGVRDAHRLIASVRVLLPAAPKASGFQPGGSLAAGPKASSSQAGSSQPGGSELGGSQPGGSGASGGGASREVAEVGRLAVVPDRQGEGIGSALLLAVEERLPAEVTEIRLFTGEHSVSNLRLYARLGYAETARASIGRYDLVHLSKPRPAQPRPAPR